MLFCKYCKISNSNCFEEHLRTAASENNKDFLEKPPVTMIITW